MKFFVLGKNGPEVINLNRRKAAREKCRNCVGWSPSEVRKCDFTWCALHPYRMGTGKQDAADRAAAIRKYCLQCCNDQPVEVRLCPCRDCSLFPFRHHKIDRSVEIETEAKKLHIEGSQHSKIKTNTPVLTRERKLYGKSPEGFYKEK